MSGRVVLTTKLTPPNSRAVLVERRRLTERLAAVAARRLTLVTAPAGYGKTSVLVHAFNTLKAEGLAPGWVSLDREENDLSQFLSYLLSAINGRDELVGRGTSALLSTGVALPPALLRDTFINDLQAVERETYVFLDDFHLVTDPTVLEVVDAVLRAPLERIHLVISSRHTRNLPLSRLRAAGELEVLDAQDLSFTGGEAREFFAHVNSIDVPDEQIELLRRRTEGWAAGLQLAAIAMRDTGSREQFLRTFSGEHRSVADFLADEVIRYQPAELQDFLLATSILRRFNASLCNAVTGRSHGNELLDRLERSNLFIFALDQERNWYRYHHLFAELLQKRLRDDRPQLVEQLHRRASDWFAANGFDVEAIEHAFAAGAIERAASLLDHCSHRLFAQGQTSTLIGFTSRLPAGMVDRLPRLQLDCAWLDELSWKFSDAHAAMERVRAELTRRIQSTPGGTPDPDTAFLLAKLAHREMMLALFADDMPCARIKAREWLDAEMTKEPFMCASAGTALLFANREQYKCEGTAAAARTLGDLFRQGGAVYGIAFHESVVGGTFFLRGELDQAEAAYERGRVAARQLHGERSPLHAMPTLMLAELCYEQHRLDDAEAMAREHDVAADLGFVDKLIAGFVTRARLAALAGQHKEAMAVLEEATYLADQLKFDRLHANVLNEQIRQLIALGQSREAVRLLREPRYRRQLEERLAPGDGVTTRHELLALASARVWLETGRETEAINLLKQWHSFTRTRHCYRSTIRLGVLLAKANLRVGNRLSAQRLVVEALQLGEAGGFVRSFLDEGQILIELLVDVAKGEPTAHTFSDTYLKRILGAAGSSPDEPGLGAGPKLDTGEAVSEREIQILNLGSRGLPNLDIAETLCLAESTVKWYWQRIFDKLDVRRRSDAIKRARHLHWIQ